MIYKYNRNSSILIIRIISIISILLFLFLLYYRFFYKIDTFTTEYIRKWSSETELIIVSAHYKEDLNWLKKVSYPVVVCSKIGADKPVIPADPKCIIENKGRETRSYLKFIITYYDELPKHIAFIHGHENAWHQTVDLLKAIECAKYNEYEYISLNGNFFIRQDFSEFHSLIIDIWNKYFKHIINIDYPINSVLHDSSAQFIVSRNNIKRFTKDIYEYWYNLFDIELPQIKNGLYTDSASDYKWGIVFELIWHIIFGEPARIDYYKDYMETRFTCFHNEKRELIVEN